MDTRISTRTVATTGATTGAMTGGKSVQLPAPARSALVGTRKLVSWIAQLGAAAILAQTLFFKFTWAPETQWIFDTKLHVGRAGATASGVAELVCVLLLLRARTAALGAALALGVMGGAVMSHLAVLGIEVIDPTTGQGDGGLLFGLALLVTALASIVAWLRRADLPLIGPRLAQLGSSRG